MTAARTVPTYDATRPCVKCGRVGTRDKYGGGITIQWADMEAARKAKAEAEWQAKWDAWRAWDCADRRTRRRMTKPEKPGTFAGPAWQHWSDRPCPPSIYRACECGFAWTERPLDYGDSAHLYEPTPPTVRP